MPEVDIPPFQPRSLEAMCTQNAVEGCVRETFGALVTGWQAARPLRGPWAQPPKSFVNGLRETLARPARVFSHAASCRRVKARG
jgi:hypothetical protein